MSDDPAAMVARAAARCRTAVVGGPPVTPAASFAALARACDELGIDEWDVYGERGAVARLESRVAELFGRDDAVLFPTGVAAQQCALRIWCDRRGTRRVAMPDVAHPLVHEEDGPRRVQGLEVERLTVGRAVPTPAALEAIPGALAAAVVELPLRDAACLLPSWDQLAAFADACRARGVPLHADGARVWEAHVAWGRPPADVGALADSVYVSLYKGLGAHAGALVACDAGFARELRVWRRRIGGTAFRMTTLAVGGLVGLRDELPRMPDHLAWARRLAGALRAEGFRMYPDQPAISTFAVFADGDADALNRRLAAYMEATSVRLCAAWRAVGAPGRAMTEFAVYSSALEHDPADVARRLTEVARPGG